MVEAEGMGLAPWGAIGRGMLKSKEEYNRADREGRKMGEQPEKYARIAGKLEEIAKKKGKEASITGVALAYVMHKAPYVFPIVGGRKVEHLKGNIDALAIELSTEEIDDIEAAEPFDVGFPLSFLFGYGGRQYKTRMLPNDLQLIATNTRLESVPKAQVSSCNSWCLHEINEMLLTIYSSLLSHARERRNGTSKKRTADTGLPERRHEPQKWNEDTQAFRHRGIRES